MTIQKREIRITITDDGEIKLDNAGNPDEQRILKELAELAQILSGDPAGVKIEKHVHAHGGHTIVHDHSEVGAH